MSTLVSLQTPHRKVLTIYIRNQLNKAMVYYRHTYKTQPVFQLFIEFAFIAVGSYVRVNS